MPARKLTYKQRRAIYKLHHQFGTSVTTLAKEYGVSQSVISQIINKRVALAPRSRADKGKKRKQEPLSEEIKPLMGTTTESIEEILEYQALTMLQELDIKKVALPERAKILDTVARIQRQLHDQKIEKYIKRPDAEIIARIVRTFKPDATDDEIVVIFNKVLEAWKEDQKK